MGASRVSRELGASTLSLETGALARQADGAVVLQQGGTVVLVTAVVSAAPSTRAGILPLTCEYRERTYAAGKIPGGFFKREGRPSEKEILTARLMDRPTRPLFPKGFLHELQVMGTVLSSDGEYDPDVLAVLGASCALRLSSIPFPDAIGVVRVGGANGRFLVNPTYRERDEGAVDLVIAATRHGVLTIEAGLRQVPEAELLAAIAFGIEQLASLIALQEELVARAGRPKRQDLPVRKPPPELVDRVRELAGPQWAAINEPKTKAAREEAVARLSASVTEQLSADGTASVEEVALAFEIVEREATRRAILEHRLRADGRSYTQLREIDCQVGVLPRTHGSGLFTRGETQSLAVTTLGTSEDEQLIEALEGKSYKRFMVHYNFPPFSVGEVRPIRGPGRREIGHGALAERALEPVVPSKEAFPYTIRVVSDILESNGSSSMATVCAGTLSLMDAGVGITAAVSGVAMGLVQEPGRAAILTDISGLEDHVGDTDFKIAGTREGVTALQVDVKLPQGLSPGLIEQIVAQSHPARMSVLDLMAAAIERPRPQLSAYAPRITTIRIHPDKIRDVIGPGGRVIRKIIEETGVSIDVEDDGTVLVASADAQKSQQAIARIHQLTEDVEVGKFYTAKVKRILNFGALCEILPGKDGLVHISELADGFVNKVDDVVKIGDEFRVKVIEIDEQGRVNLSRKRALESAAQTVDDGKPPERSERPEGRRPPGRRR
jgi:polyribonucleotide nucleotidyltransferase